MLSVQQVLELRRLIIAENMILAILGLLIVSFANTSGSYIL